MQKRILVVDDDEMNLTRTKIILKKDYDVLLASSGLDALHILNQEKVDLVLLDIERLRNLPAHERDRRGNTGDLFNRFRV